MTPRLHPHLRALMTKNGEIAVIFGIAALSIALRIAFFSPFDIMHPDEMVQYLAQGQRIANGHGIIPWESRLGVRNALIPQFLAIWLRLGQMISPGTLFGMYLARATFAALTMLTLPAAWMIGALTSRRHAIAALFAVAVWWESILFNELLLTESLSAALLLLAAAPLLATASERPKRGPLLASGVLLGLGVLVRFQYAPFAAALALGTLRFDWRRWRYVLLGALAACALGALSDLIDGRVPFAWALTNVRINVTDGVAARFGTSGPGAYLQWMRIHLTPAFWPLLLVLSKMGKRYIPLALAALVIIILHSAIGHKEYRFIWLAVLTLIVLAAIASVNLADWATRWWQGVGDPSVKSAAILALVCAGWLALSIIGEHRTNGFTAYRQGSQGARLIFAAASRSGVCGIAIKNSRSITFIPSMLPHGPIVSILPASLANDPLILPPSLAASANALVTTASLPQNSAYRRVECQPSNNQTPCLYIRSGSCTPAMAAWSYQADLDRWASTSTGIGLPYRRN